MAGSGCASRPRLVDAPPAAPAQLAGRRLWPTSAALIYARDESLAAETQQWIESLAAHLARTYHASLGKGLVVVTDLHDAPVVESFDELVRLESLAPAARSASPTSPEARRRRLSDAGMTEEMARQVATVPLDDAVLKRHVGDVRAFNDVQWRICCPSQRLALRVTQQFAPKAIEKQKGRAFAMLTASVIPIASLEAAKVFALARDALAFDLWAARRADWDDARRKRESAQYLKERAFLISPMLAMALAIAKKGGPATASAPASRPAGP